MFAASTDPNKQHIFQKYVNQKGQNKIYCGL